VPHAVARAKAVLDQDRLPFLAQDASSSRYMTPSPRLSSRRGGIGKELLLAVDLERLDGALPSADSTQSMKA